MTDEHSNYKWYVLALVVLTNIIVVAMPAMGMSVLAKEISQDLKLNLVQVGVVWGIGALPGIVTGLIGGAVGDKLGPKRILIAASLLSGLVGAARGLASDFLSLTVIVIFLGALIPFVSMNGFKTCGQWFPSRQLGLANGLISMGMALGFLLGALLSASFLSPWLGGWRNVLLLYGLSGALLCIPWIFTRPLPAGHAAHSHGEGLSIRRAVLAVARVKNIWLLGLAYFGVGGCIQGLLGYLPLYLRSLGWPALQADGTLSAFHTASMLCVMPIALWSDRLGSRKWLLLGAAGLVALGTGLLSVVSGGAVWAAVLLAGFVRDAFMAIFLTMTIETRGIGPRYAGTATGLVMAVGGIASFLAPPLGNSLAALAPGAPFAFWSALAVFGMVCIALTEGGLVHPEPGAVNRRP
jgi:MFS family permease